MLKLENVRKQYPNFQLDCSLEVKDGCVTGLIGQNGAGKTTTFIRREGASFCSARTFGR